MILVKVELVLLSVTILPIPVTLMLRAVNSSKKMSTKVKALGSIKSDGLKNMLDNLW